MTLAALSHDEPPQVVTTAAPATMQPIHALDERNTLCIACSKPELILQKGDADFGNQVAQHYQFHESNVNEGLIALKKQLRLIHDATFWSTATFGLGELLGAQYAFVMKRLDDDAKGEVGHGQAGSCMLGMSVYVQNESGVGQASGEGRYMAHGSPCEYMKHNKVLLIPENMSSVVTNNPNKLPSQPEAYMAAPLSYIPAGETEEKVFGHFGLMWTAEGLARKQLSFSQIENILHSLEDLFVSKFYEFGHLDRPVQGGPEGVINAPTMNTSLTTKPLDSNSFKPYARSLSHELRTPMQGVVGMLDLMYAAVQEASEGSPDPEALSVFRMLKDNIEEVHDSARRAVEAADNVVHAYDMNMGVSDAPVYNNEEEDLPTRKSILASQAIESNTSDSSSPPRSSRKRRSRDETTTQAVYKVPRLDNSYQTTPTDSPWKSREHGLLDSPIIATPVGSTGTPYSEVMSTSGHLTLERTIAPGVRSTVISDTLQSIINDVIKIGGRPESAIAHPIDGGEEIEVHHRSKGGADKVRMVRWTVDDSVPESIVVDERDLAGLLSRVLHNAFKFTESGSIDTTVRLSPKGKYILINVADTGHGIPKAFMPSLFKPFSKEDDSTTRQSEGLGLGLMVAKGLARRMNGDLYAIRSETEGENRGSEFEMRIPLRPGDSISQSSTPYGSRSPSARSMSVEVEPSIPIAVSVLTPRSPQPQLRPQLRRGGPRHHRSGSLLSRNTMAPSAFSSHAAISAHLSAPMPTPPLTASPVPPPINATSQPRSSPPATALRRNSHLRKTPPYRQAGGKLAAVLPLSFLVVEDNSLLRKVLVQMLRNLGYTRIHEAYDGVDALRQMEDHRSRYLGGQVSYEIDFVLMDLWMPNMNGYSAAEHIIRNAAESMEAQLGAGNVVDAATHKAGWKMPIVMAVTADVTDEAMESVQRSGMKGPLTKPYKQIDLERTLVELCGIPVAPPVIAGF